MSQSHCNLSCQVKSQILAEEREKQGGKTSCGSMANITVLAMGILVCGLVQGHLTVILWTAALPVSSFPYIL